MLAVGAGGGSSDIFFCGLSFFLSWVDGCLDFTSFSIQFQLYQDDGWVMDDCAVYDRNDLSLKRCSNSGPLDQQASAYITELPGLLSLGKGSI